jgi:hypothetical protein
VVDGVARFFLPQLTKNEKNNTELVRSIKKDALLLFVKCLKIYHTAISKISKAWPLKIYQKWDFWYVNIPSGNPGGRTLGT